MTKNTPPNEIAKELLANGKIQTNAWIDGASVETEQIFTRISPIDGQPVAQIADCSKQNVLQATSVARRSFNDGRWHQKAPEERQKIIANFAELIRAHSAQLATIESLENGMAYGMCKNRNIAEAADCWQWYGDAFSKLHDDSMWINKGTFSTISKEPVGVVGIITPWNFPMMIAAWKAAPALAAGCTLVIKPSEMASSAIAQLGALAKQACIPDGVINIVPGQGGIAGAALVESADVDCIAFTGSSVTGKTIMRAASDSLKRVSMECGGKSSIIIHEDYSDFTGAVEMVARAFFRHQGQICNATSRLLIPAKRVDEAAKIAMNVANSLVIGNPLEAATEYGPVISEQALNNIVAAVGRAVDAGATLVCGGHAIKREGSYMQPTILSHILPTMEAAQQEIFGPVMSIMPYQDEEEAIAIANGTVYGLGAGLFVDDLSKAHLLAKKLHAGQVLINAPAGASLRLPFGGVKQSGFGRDKSLYAFDKYTELKSTVFNLGT